MVWVEGRPFLSFGPVLLRSLGHRCSVVLHHSYLPLILEVSQLKWKVLAMWASLLRVKAGKSSDGAVKVTVWPGIIPSYSPPLLNLRFNITRPQDILHCGSHPPKILATPLPHCAHRFQPHQQCQVSLHAFISSVQQQHILFHVLFHTWIHVFH